MAKSNIEWTDYSWNFVTGCNKVSAGCKNCYAETIANRFWKDRKFTDVQIDEDKINLPFHLRKPRQIFVNSMSDLFHEKIPLDIIKRAYIVMQENPQHIYQILTKRPQRALEFYNSEFFPHVGGLSEPKFIWLGVSVENQKAADERIPLLLQTPAAIRWLSIEPMLEKISFRWMQPISREHSTGHLDILKNISWVVVGCESGYNRRECKIEWVEGIVEQCKEANIPVFVKQLQINYKVVKDINLFPKHLQIREYPKTERSA